MKRKKKAEESVESVEITTAPIEINMTALNGAVSEAGNSLLANSVMFSMSCHAWRNATDGNLSEEGVAAIDADRKRIKLRKKLISAREYQEILSEMTYAKRWCLDRCALSYIENGIYFVKRDMVEEFDAHLTAVNDRIAGELVPALVAVWDDCIERARAELRSQFNIADYPSAGDLFSKFRITWKWITLSVAEGLPDEIREKEMAKMEAELISAQAEITMALRESFKSLIDHAAEKLMVTPGEKPKIFRNSMIENIDQFLDLFKARNIANDKELEKLVIKARQVIAGCDPDELRKRTDLRINYAEQFTALSKTIGGMIETKRTRRFDLSDEA